MVNIILYLFIVNWLITIICSGIVGWVAISAYRDMGVEGVSLLMESPTIKRLSTSILATTIVGLLMVQAAYIMLINS